MIGSGGQSKRAQHRVSYRRVICETGETNLEVLSDFTNEPLEGQLADEELRRLLVPTNLTESDSSRPETMRLLHTTCRRCCCLASLRLSCELLTRGLACTRAMRLRSRRDKCRRYLPPVDLRAVCLVRAIASSRKFAKSEVAGLECGSGGR